MSFFRPLLARSILALVLCLVWCGSAISKPTMRALVIGGADGAVFGEIKSEYHVSYGHGGENNPEIYDLLIFDGDRVTPDQLRTHSGIRNFLNAGKAVVILDNTEPHRQAALSGIGWAHAEGGSPGVAFMIQRDRNGIAQQLVQLDFPEHQMMSPPPGGITEPPLTLTDAQLQQDSIPWLSVLRSRLQGTPGNVAPAVTTDGQAILSFDHVESVTPQQNSVLNGQPPPGGTTWGRDGSEPPNFSTTLNATFETLVYAILEGNSQSTYQHKIIARQYLLVSPPSPLSTALVSTQHTTSEANWSGTWPVYSTLGFNGAFTLGVQLLNTSDLASPLGIVENQPEAVNNVTSLTTSESHAETVGLSATFGVQNGNPLGTVGASWSDSWSWGQAQTVSFHDWASDSQVDIKNNAANYNFVAFGGSDVTAATLNEYLLQLPPSVGQIATQLSAPFYYYPPKPPSLPALNQLQTSAMTNQSETAWATSNGQLVPPQLLQLVSSALIYSGELLELTSGLILPG